VLSPSAAGHGRAVQRIRQVDAYPCSARFLRCVVRVWHPSSIRLGAGASLDFGPQILPGLAQFHRLMGEPLFQIGLGFPQGRLQILGHGDVGKGNHHAVDPVLLCPVGHDAHREPAFVAGGDLFLDKDEPLQHLVAVLGQVGIVQHRDDVGDGATDVTGDKLDDADGLGGEASYEERIVQEEGGNVSAVEQVLHVIARVGYPLVSANGVAVRAAVARWSFRSTRGVVFFMA
jgi:hypothetical protein